jgi:hypothetical protein
MRRLLERWDPYLALLLGLSLLSLAPLAAPGYFFGAHDGRHSVFFISMFDESIRSGALWPRWAMHHNLGYGYPTFVIQAPLAFYVAELFVWAGAGIALAAKWTWAVAVLSGAWGMYALVKHWCVAYGLFSPGLVADRRGSSSAALCGVAAGILYTYAPYHLLDIYVRAALAETLLMAWFPWVFLAFDRLIAQGSTPGRQGRLLVAALTYAGALLTHVFALAAFTPVLAAFILFRLWFAARMDGAQAWGVRARVLVQRTLLSLSAGIGGLLLAAVFLVPLLVESRFLVQENWTRATYDYARHWVYAGQFFSPFWGFGYSDDPVGANDGMGFQQGAILLLLAFCAAYVVLHRMLAVDTRNFARTATAEAWPHRLDPLQTLMLFFVVATVAILFATTPAAAGVWRSVALLEIIQFPWRLLAPAAFTLSIVGGLVIGWVADATERWRVDVALRTEAGILALVLISVLAGAPYSRPRELQPIAPWREDGRAVAEFEREHPDMQGYTRYNIQPFAESPMQPEYLAAQEEAQPFDSNRLTRLVVVAGEGTVRASYGMGHAFGGMVEMATAGSVQIQLLAFPGWQVKVNGVEVEPRIVPPYGLMEIDLPAGSSEIAIWMGVTPAGWAGVITSGLTLLLLVGLWQAERYGAAKRAG